MRVPSLFVSVCLALLCSCTTDVTKSPSTRTDFVVGQSYELKKSTYLLHGSLMTLREKAPADSEGTIPPGERVVVRKVRVFRSPELGTTTEVFAEVLSGSYKGRSVSLTAVSHVSASGYTQRDPSMLEIVEMGAR